MPSKIRVLDEQTINKIAAGEVIENPASVVKELVENSLDAGSTDICIEIKEGGRQLIRITDNGCGMNGDDALLCLERHATSKIRDVNDIYAIGTMGFRGEAVPSIAAISKFTLMTCDNATGVGTMVIIEGGRIMQCSPIAHSVGTTIEVKSLFFNVPVRKKFQKSPAYDANEILRIVNGIALGYPHVKFQLISDQKTLLSTTWPTASSFQEQLGERIKEILGIDFFESTCKVEGVNEEYRIEGYIGLPLYTRHNRSGQHLLINQRAVISPLINFAIRDGYGTMLSSNRHPVYVLHMTIPGTLIDVNVHPQKREVRLRQEAALKELITHSIGKALQGTPHTPPYTDYIPSFAPIPPQPSMPSFIQQPYRVEVPFELPAVPERYLADTKPVPAAIPLPLNQQPKARPVRVLATLRHYIVLDGSVLDQPDSLCLMDQRAAHARIIFERLSLNSTEQIAVQHLLIPYTFEATPLEGALLLENLENLNRFGLSLRQAGPHTFLIDAIPQVFGNSNMDSLLTETLQIIREEGDHDLLKKKQEKLLAMAASRAAISSSRRLTMEEAQALAIQLMDCEHPFQCPQGKPTIVSVSQEELLQRFQKQ